MSLVVCLHILFSKTETIFHIFIKLSIHLRVVIKTYYGTSLSGQENKPDLGGDLTFQLVQLDHLVRDQPWKDGFTVLKREVEYLIL